MYVIQEVISQEEICNTILINDIAWARITILHDKTEN